MLFDAVCCCAAGGLNDLISEILKACKINQIPVVFALKRYNLGCTIGKKRGVSAIGILDYDGVNELFHTAIRLAEMGRRQYSRLTSASNKETESKQATTTTTTKMTATQVKPSSCTPAMPINTVTTTAMANSDSLSSKNLLQTVPTSSSPPPKLPSKMSAAAPSFIPRNDDGSAAVLLSPSFVFRVGQWSINKTSADH